MSVLQRKELEDSPLADLHAIASELGIESYRALRRDDLIGSILDAGPGDSGSRPDESVDDGEGRPKRRRARRAPRGRTGRSRDTDDGDDGDSSDDDGGDEGDSSEEESVSGVLDIVAGGSGFVRVAGVAHSETDAYVSPAQIRRCELRCGDEIVGRARPPRRGERHPSLVRVEQVNGSEAEPPEERQRFEELTAVHPSERLAAPPALKKIPFGRGSRVAIIGLPGSGATRLLREIVATLIKDHDDLTVSAVLVGARPEEVTDWQREAGVPVVGGSFEVSLEVQGQTAELAIERAKRLVERGKHAVVVVDSLEQLQQGVARRLFGAGRKVEDGGSLTVIAAAGLSGEAQRQASTLIALDPASDKGETQVAERRSHTLRADLLA